MRRQNKRILLLEPDSVLARPLKLALKRGGYSVVHVHSAQEAVSQADRLMPDLVICELQLTAHSGIEFLYEFRSYSDWAALPVIINSSVPPVEFSASREGLLNELNVAAYLYKPSTSLAEIVRLADRLTREVPSGQPR